ncbi:uncharacterized protein B0P05DRAFT_560800 [Gilbertella persicaria]|uniref:Uncharacterized protein n=1 Tax=Rhizopus stolonifer TaxID=4846 RepID=A0A367KUU6_RHIST|nr:uncharacterized protein B0P05DRAFT_560800 [Gilbertella persicaria]KAI8054928.1 hypothetical protein B0P05DRAFT_560800 [Gilbertella persicaria]RCI05971.1 hypothetical protein CU098_011780 [Rhizopus stolonifer]
MSNLHIAQKIANVVVYLFFLSATVYNIVGPSPNKDVILEGQTYFTPSYWIEYIWTLIHVLLGGFVIYQWFEPAHEAAIHGVGWHFVLSVLLNAIWLTLLKQGHFIIGLIFALLTASSVSYVFYRLEKNYPSTSWWDKLFVHAPFSLWHGWIVFSVVINFFQAFTSIKEDGPHTLHRILAILAVVFLTSTAIGYVEFKKSKGDVTGAMVIGLGLLAVFTNQHDAWIHWPALVGAIITLIYPARPYVFRLVGRNSNDENAPLLG